MTDARYPWSSFIQVTSTRDTPIFFRREAVLIVEAITINETSDHYPGHVGTRVTLRAGEWSESVVCIEAVTDVFDLIEPQPRPIRE